MRIRDSRSGWFRQRRPERYVRNAAVALLSFALLAILGVVTGWSQVYSQQDQRPMRDPSGLPPPNPTANPQPNANQRMLYRMQQQENLKRIEKLNLLRHKEMEEDTSRLLGLAAEVKAVTRRNGPDSDAVIALRQVEAIAKLAHGVQEKMKITVN